MSFRFPDPKARPLVVVGAGVLGRRIACTWAAAGYTVHIFDLVEDVRNAALEFVRDNVLSIDFVRLTPDHREPGQVFAFDNLASATKGAWLVIEAVPEKLDLKIDVMAEIEKVVPPDCIVGSNSSSYKSSLMVKKLSQSFKARVCNIHYSMPPIALIVELMTDGDTVPEIFPFLERLHADIGMYAATAYVESTGFIIGRVWAAIKREIMMTLAEGVIDAESFDKIFMQTFSTHMAPCLLMDQIGLDTVAFIEDNYIKERGLTSTLTVDWLRKNYIDKGQLGVKSGQGGFYPPGRTIQPRSEKRDKHETVSSSTTLEFYVLDIGLGDDHPIGKSGHSGRVLAISANGDNVREVITGLPCPDGIQVSTRTKTIFFANMGEHPDENDGSIMCAKLDGSELKTIIPKGATHTGKQLVLDEKNKNVYWSDREGLRIHRCDFDGSNHEVLVQTGDWRNEAHKQDMSRWCVGISIDTKHEHLYWSQKGAAKGGQGRIFRASLNLPAGTTADTRSDIETLFVNLPEPIDLEIVPETQMLYWTDRGEYPRGNTLNQADVGKGGHKQQVVLARHFHEAIGLKLDPVDQHIYVTDLGGSIYRFGMDGKNKKVIYHSEGCFTGIALVRTSH